MAQNASEIDESVFRHHEIGIGGVIHEVIFGIAVFLLLVIGPIGFRSRLDLLRGAGEAQHSRVHDIGEFSQLLGGVAFGVDRDEHRLDIDAALIEEAHRFGVARIVERADIGAEGVAEIDERGAGDHILFGDGIPVLIHERKGAADIARASCYPAGTASREGIIRARGIGLVKKKAGESGSEDEGQGDKGFRHFGLHVQRIR